MRYQTIRPRVGTSPAIIGGTFNGPNPWSCSQFTCVTLCDGTCTTAKTHTNTKQRRGAICTTAYHSWREKPPWPWLLAKAMRPILHAVMGVFHGDFSCRLVSSETHFLSSRKWTCHLFLASNRPCSILSTLNQAEIRRGPFCSCSRVNL